MCVPDPQPRAAPTADASRGTHEGMFIFAGHVGAYSLDRGPVCNFYTPHPLLSYVRKQVIMTQMVDTPFWQREAGQHGGTVMLKK